MKTLYFNRAIGEAIAEEMANDLAVLVIGQDIGVYGGAFGVTRGLLDKFGPNRVIETPISENSIVGLAVGLAVKGFKPIVEIMFMDFIALAMDQIVNHAAKLHYIYGGQVTVPLVIRTPAGVRGGYGSTHSQSLQQWFLSVPGLKVVAPSSPAMAKGLLRSAIHDPNPVLFVENKMLYSTKGPVSEQEVRLPIERAVVVREGRDCTVVAHSQMVLAAFEAAERLAGEGIEVEVVDMVSLNPIDRATLIESVRKTQRLVVAEEGVVTGGIGAEVVSLMVNHALDALDGPIQRVGMPMVPIPAAPSLEKAILPSADAVEAAVRRTMEW